MHSIRASLLIGRWVRSLDSGPMSNDVETAAGALSPFGSGHGRDAMDAADGLPHNFDAVPVGLTALDLSGRIRRVNPAQSRLAGWRADDLEGRLVFESLAVEDGQRLRELLARHRGVDDEGIDVELLRPDGSQQRCVVHVARVVNAQCDPAGWLVSWTPQVSPRASTGANRLYEVTLNAIDDSVSVVDALGTFQMVNDAWCRRHRMARAQVIGRLAADVFEAFDLGAAMPAFRGCLRDRRMTRAFLEVERIPGGRQRIRLDFYPFGDDAGEAPHVVIVERVETQPTLMAA